ncbi:hypothetical protein DFH06DRAFT_1232301 [Mycena polygramma]|nr:hypothetical protein DFH06DRAFT_1232301 [Mycena polygramma]
MAAVDLLRARIDELSSDIKRHEEILQNLRKSKSDAQCELNAILDPMARLPLEILSEILALCVPNLPRPSRVEAPLAFLRVSRAWKTVALSSAPLWTALLIRSPWNDELPSGADRWLARARGLPLSLHVEGTVDTVIQALVRKYASRLQDLEIYCGRGMQNPTALYTSLKTLTMRHRYSTEKNRTYPRSPCLRMLHNSRNLVECTFDGSDCCLHDAPPAQPLELPSLKYLNLINSIGEILVHLTLPALESIQLTSRRLRFDTFRAFMSRSLPPLQSLFIRWPGYTEMQDICLPLSGLSELSLQGGRSSDIFKLLARSSPQEFLPNLRQLTVRQMHQSVFNDDYTTLLTALSARRPSPESCLKSFSLSLGLEDSGPCLEIVVSLRELVADGMDIRITQAGESFI